MNCFDRNRCHLGCVDLWDDKDLLGSEFPDHLDHGIPNEPMNFSPVESSVHLIFHDLRDLGSLILIQIISKNPLLIIYMP